jgi:hypothetical protein
MAGILRNFTEIQKIIGKDRSRLGLGDHIHLISNRQNDGHHLLFKGVKFHVLKTVCV